jgi:predicted PurR-regulated permease PerM
LQEQEQEQEIKPPKLSRYTYLSFILLLLLLLLFVVVVAPLAAFFTKYVSYRDAADVDAVKNVLEGIIQSPTSTKNICGVHRLDQQILNKVLENLKNSITQETLNQLTNSLQV